MVGIKSDAGNVRELNEDYASFIEDERFKIYLVADGMGGHNAGEIHNSLSLLAQDGYNFIIDPIFLYRTAAVGQHNGIACVQLCVQCLLGGALSKIDVSGMFISKIFHGIFAPSPLVVDF